jgi:hypothetical protein
VSGVEVAAAGVADAAGDAGAWVSAFTAAGGLAAGLPSVNAKVQATVSPALTATSTLRLATLTSEVAVSQDTFASTSPLLSRSSTR